MNPRIQHKLNRKSDPELERARDTARMLKVKCMKGEGSQVEEALYESLFQYAYGTLTPAQKGR